MTLKEAQAMTPEEKSITLAGLTGWTDIEMHFGTLEGKGYDYLHGKMPSGSTSRLPDYCNDLNAVHGIERSLPSHLWTDYAMDLRKVIQKECCKPECYIPGTERAQLIADIWFYGATADQRTTALILTLSTQR